MSARDYEKAVYQATGFPDPEEVEEAQYHHLGDWEIHETGDAIDAIVEHRLQRVRNAIKEAASLPSESRMQIEEQDFLGYSEYLETLRRMGNIRHTLDRIGNKDRKQSHDDNFHPDKPHFYQTISPPNPKETALASRLSDLAAVYGFGCENRIFWCLAFAKRLRIPQKS